MSREEGLLIGGSCGTAVYAALVVAEELTKDDLVVVLVPDSGRGYLSTVFNDQWMAGFGFIRGEGAVVADVLDAKEGDIPPLLYVRPDMKVREAVSLMHEHDVSQLPVAKTHALSGAQSASVPQSAGAGPQCACAASQVARSA